MFHVYILYSEKVDQYYVGYTNGLDRRLGEHNRRKGKFTDRGIPWSIVYTVGYENKEEAQLREKEIKKRKSRQFIEQLVSSAQ